MTSLKRRTARRPSICRATWQRSCGIDNYYVPYVKGFFASSGRFRSDDMKTGNVLAFVGSSAGCTFFPDHVTNGDGDSYDIEVKTYQAPKFEGGADYAVQQGAGMVIINKSDAQVEAAASSSGLRRATGRLSFPSVPAICR